MCLCVGGVLLQIDFNQCPIEKVKKTGNFGSLKLRVNYSIMNVKYVVPSDIMY